MLGGDFMPQTTRRYKSKKKIGFRRRNQLDYSFRLSSSPVKVRLKKYDVHGFIDAIYEMNGSVMILDYKTSRKGDMTPDYYLQLGIYAVMYEEVKGVKPNVVGIDFLNHQELLMPVDDKLISETKKELKLIHTKTTSLNKEDYIKKPSPLCKWKTGQCDYYEKCFPGTN